MPVNQKKERKYYTTGPEKPPIFVQAIIDNKEMSADDFFHITDSYLDWTNPDDDDAITKPLVEFLSKWGDELIFAFDDKMTELLYSLDTKKIASDIYKDENFSGDEFLYIRCAALINSKRFYDEIIKGRRKMKRDLEFEAILYVPQTAWARLHNAETEDYPHDTKLSYETMSNTEGWESFINDVTAQHHFLMR